MSGNPGRVIIGLVGNILRLDEAQGTQHPMLDVLLSGDVVGEIGQLACLLERESHSWCAPLSREKFLPIMLDQLQGRIAQNQVLPEESNEQRATGLRLSLSRGSHAVGIDVYQRNRRFGAVSLGIEDRHQHDLSFTSVKLDIFPRPGRTEYASQLFVTDYSQRAAEGKETATTGKIGIG